MKGDLMCIDGQWRWVVSETIITASVALEPEQKAGRSVQAMQTFQYTVVRTAPIPQQEPPREWAARI